MSRVAVLGESPRVDLWALAGALVVAASQGEEVRHAWYALPDDVEVVVLTSAAARVLGDLAAGRLVVVMP